MIAVLESGHQCGLGRRHVVGMVMAFHIAVNNVAVGGTYHVGDFCEVNNMGKLGTDPTNYEQQREPRDPKTGRRIPVAMVCRPATCAAIQRFFAFCIGML